MTMTGEHVCQCGQRMTSDLEVEHGECDDCAAVRLRREAQEYEEYLENRCDP